MNRALKLFLHIGIAGVALFILFLFQDSTDAVVRFDARHGSSVLVQNNAMQYVIGVGSDASIVSGLSRHISWFDRRIEVVVLPSFADKDVGGMWALLSRYDIGVVLLPAIDNKKPLNEDLIKRLQEKRIPYRYIQIGSHIRQGELDIMVEKGKLSVLAPSRLSGMFLSVMQSGESGEVSVSNFKKGIFMKCYNETDLLFMQKVCMHKVIP